MDGTTNLIRDFRHSAISLALAEGGQIAFGVVYNPYTGACFTAQKGQGAFCNPASNGRLHNALQTILKE